MFKRYFTLFSQHFFIPLFYIYAQYCCFLLYWYCQDFSVFDNRWLIVRKLYFTNFPSKLTIQSSGDDIYYIRNFFLLLLFLSLLLIKTCYYWLLQVQQNISFYRLWRTMKYFVCQLSNQLNILLFFIYSYLYLWITRFGLIFYISKLVYRKFIYYFTNTLILIYYFFPLHLFTCWQLIGWFRQLRSKSKKKKCDQIFTLLNHCYDFFFICRIMTVFLFSASVVRLRDFQLPYYHEVGYPITWTDTASLCDFMYNNDGFFYWTVVENLNSSLLTKLSNHFTLPLFLDNSIPLKETNFLTQARNNFANVPTEHDYVIIENFYTDIYQIFIDQYKLVLLNELKCDPFAVFHHNLATFEDLHMRTIYNSYLVDNGIIDRIFAQLDIQYLETGNYLKMIWAENTQTFFISQGFSEDFLFQLLQKHGYWRHDQYLHPDVSSYWYELFCEIYIRFSPYYFFWGKAVTGMGGSVYPSFAIFGSTFYTNPEPVLVVIYFLFFSWYVPRCLSFMTTYTDEITPEGITQTAIYQNQWLDFRFNYCIPYLGFDPCGDDEENFVLFFVPWLLIPLYIDHPRRYPWKTVFLKDYSRYLIAATQNRYYGYEGLQIRPDPYIGSFYYELSPVMILMDLWNARATKYTPYFRNLTMPVWINYDMRVGPYSIAMDENFGIDFFEKLYLQSFMSNSEDDMSDDYAEAFMSLRENRGLYRPAMFKGYTSFDSETGELLRYPDERKLRKKPPKYEYRLINLDHTAQRFRLFEHPHNLESEEVPSEEWRYMIENGRNIFHGFSGLRTKYRAIDTLSNEKLAEELKQMLQDAKKDDQYNVQELIANLKPIRDTYLQKVNNLYLPLASHTALPLRYIYESDELDNDFLINEFNDSEGSCSYEACSEGSLRPVGAGLFRPSLLNEQQSLFVTEYSHRNNFFLPTKLQFGSGKIFDEEWENRLDLITIYDDFYFDLDDDVDTLEDTNSLSGELLESSEGIWELQDKDNSTQKKINSWYRPLYNHNLLTFREIDSVPNSTVTESNVLLDALFDLMELPEESKRYATIKNALSTDVFFEIVADRKIQTLNTMVNDIRKNNFKEDLSFNLAAALSTYLLHPSTLDYWMPQLFGGFTSYELNQIELLAKYNLSSEKNIFSSTPYNFNKIRSADFPKRRIVDPRSNTMFAKFVSKLTLAVNKKKAAIKAKEQEALMVRIDLNLSLRTVLDDTTVTTLTNYFLNPHPITKQQLLEQQEQLREQQERLTLDDDNLIDEKSDEEIVSTNNYSNRDIQQILPLSNSTNITLDDSELRQLIQYFTVCAINQKQTSNSFKKLEPHLSGSPLDYLIGSDYQENRLNENLEMFDITNDNKIHMYRTRILDNSFNRVFGLDKHYLLSAQHIFYDYAKQENEAENRDETELNLTAQLQVFNFPDLFEKLKNLEEKNAQRSGLFFNHILSSSKSEPELLNEQSELTLDETEEQDFVTTNSNESTSLGVPLGKKKRTREELVALLLKQWDRQINLHPEPIEEIPLPGELPLYPLHIFHSFYGKLYHTYSINEQEINPFNVVADISGYTAFWKNDVRNLTIVVAEINKLQKDVMLLKEFFFLLFLNPDEVGKMVKNIQDALALQTDSTTHMPLTIHDDLASITENIADLVEGSISINDLESLVDKKQTELVAELHGLTDTTTDEDLTKLIKNSRSKYYAKRPTSTLIADELFFLSPFGTQLTKKPKNQLSLIAYDELIQNYAICILDHATQKNNRQLFLSDAFFRMYFGLNDIYLPYKQVTADFNLYRTLDYLLNAFAQTMITDANMGPLVSQCFLAPQTWITHTNPEWFHNGLLEKYPQQNQKLWFQKNWSGFLLNNWYLYMTTSREQFDYQCIKPFTSSVIVLPDDYSELALDQLLWYYQLYYDFNGSTQTSLLSFYSGHNRNERHQLLTEQLDFLPMLNTMFISALEPHEYLRKRKRKAQWKKLDAFFEYYETALAEMIGLTDLETDSHADYPPFEAEDDDEIYDDVDDLDGEFFLKNYGLLRPWTQTRDSFTELYDQSLLVGIYNVTQLVERPITQVTQGRNAYTPVDIFGLYCENSLGYTPYEWFDVYDLETETIYLNTPFLHFEFKNGLYLRRNSGFHRIEDQFQTIANEFSLIENIENVFTGFTEMESTLGLEHAITTYWSLYFGLIPAQILDGFVYSFYWTQNWLHLLYQSSFIDVHLQQMPLNTSETQLVEIDDQFFIKPLVHLVPKDNDYDQYYFMNDDIHIRSSVDLLPDYLKNEWSWNQYADTINALRIILTVFDELPDFVLQQTFVEANYSNRQLGETTQRFCEITQQFRSAIIATYFGTNSPQLPELEFDLLNLTDVTYLQEKLQQAMEFSDRTECELLDYHSIFGNHITSHSIALKNRLALANELVSQLEQQQRISGLLRQDDYAKKFEINLLAPRVYHLYGKTSAKTPIMFDFPDLTSNRNIMIREIPKAFPIESPLQLYSKTLDATMIQRNTFPLVKYLFIHELGATKHYYNFLQQHPSLINTYYYFPFHLSAPLRYCLFLQRNIVPSHFVEETPYPAFQ